MHLKLIFFKLRTKYIKGVKRKLETFYGHICGGVLPHQ